MVGKPFPMEKIQMRVEIDLFRQGDDFQKRVVEQNSVCYLVRVGSILQRALPR